MKSTRSHHVDQYSCICLLSALLLFAGCQSTPSSPNYGVSTRSEVEFQKAANRQPIPETLYAVTRILVSQGRDADAAQVLHRLIEEHPRFVPAYNEMAELHMRNRRLGNALEVLQAGLQVAPDNAALLNNLGMCWMIRNRYDRALEYFTRAAAASPDDARFRANVAAALGMQGRYDEALAVYKQIVTEPEAHYNIGVISQARNDHEQAEQAFATAVAMKKGKNARE